MTEYVLDIIFYNYMLTHYYFKIFLAQIYLHFRFNFSFVLLDFEMNYYIIIFKYRKHRNINPQSSYFYIPQFKINYFNIQNPLFTIIIIYYSNEMFKFFGFMFTVSNSAYYTLHYKGFSLAIYYQLMMNMKMKYPKHFIYYCFDLFH